MEVLREGNADAVLAASIFHFGEFTVPETKKYLQAQGIPVRPDFESQRDRELVGEEDY